MGARMAALTASLQELLAQRPSAPAAAGSQDAPRGTNAYDIGTPRAPSPRRNARSESMAGDAPSSGGHIVLLQFSSPQLKGVMQGIEANAGSKMPAAPPQDSVSSPKYHDFLTLNFGSLYCHMAATYTQIMDSLINDPAGRTVQVIHNGGEEQPPIGRTAPWPGHAGRLRVDAVQHR